MRPKVRIKAASPLVREVVALLDRSDLGQVKLGEMAGYSPSTISAMRTGRRVSPGVTLIEDLLQVIGYRLAVVPLVERVAPLKVLSCEEIG